MPKVTLRSDRKMEMKFLVILFTTVAIGAQCRSVEFPDVGFVEGEDGQVNMSEQLKELMTLDENNFENLNFAIKINGDKDNNEQWIQFLNQLSSFLTQFVSRQIIPEQTMPQQFVPEQIFPEQTIPEQTIPGQIIPEQTIPEQVIPDQTITDQTIPEQTITEQTIPEQTFPNRREARNMYIKVDNDSILQIPNNKPTIRNMNDLKDLLDYMKEIDIIYQDGDNTDEHIRIKRAAGYEKTASFATLEERMTNMLIDIKHQLMQIQKCLDKLCKKHHLTSTIISEEISDNNTSPINQPNKESMTVE